MQPQHAYAIGHDPDGKATCVLTSALGGACRDMLAVDLVALAGSYVGARFRGHWTRSGCWTNTVIGNSVHGEIVR